MRPPVLSRLRGPLVAATALAAGCGDERPRAPALTTEAVYRNDAAGLRFLAPDGWIPVAKTTPPAGPLDHPVRLASFQPKAAERPAELELYAVDLPENADVTAYLTANPFGSERWTARPPRPETVNGAAATRWTLTAARPGSDGRREVVHFRRGGRAFLFVLTYPASVPSLGDQGRRSIETATWQ